MKHYGLTIAEGSEITNPTVATGTSFPGNESTGELFFRTDTDTLYVWDGSTWDSAGGGIQEVLDDPTPQLGGNLDVNDYNITGGTASIELNSASASLIRSADGTAGLQLSVEAGAGTSGNGGALSLSGGDGSVTGGTTTIRSGDGTTGNAGDIILQPGSGVSNLGGFIQIKPPSGSTTAPSVVFMEAATNGTSGLYLRAPDSLSAIRFWTLPDDDPSLVAGQFLTTDSSGIWSFATAGGNPGGSDRQVQFNDSSSFGGSSALVLESDGTLNVAGTTDYEDLVTSDDDIPNKKYVDDAIANSPEYSTQNILYQYTATSGQTTFTGTDNNGKTLTYSDASELMVFKTGTLLDPTDYTATNGTDVVLDTGAEAGAEINIMRFVSVERYDTLQTFRYLMDTGETTASGTDAKGNTLTYAVGLINVFLNGGKLSEDQYTATDGTSIVLDDALPDDNNILEVQTFSTFTSIDEVVARANMIINPNMDVWQRNTSVTSVANSAFVADRWQFTASGAGVFDMSRSTDAPVGSEYSLDLTVTTADASIGSTDYYGFLQTIEGNNIRGLNMGTSNAQPITLSFYVKSSVSGTYTICFRNKNAGASYRTYVAEYTVDTADTWERKVITLDGDTGGTWNSDEAGGLEIFFWMAAGSAFHTTAGSWATGNLISSANQVNAVGTVSNSFKVTQVRCEVGSIAAEFRSRSIGEEIALCQRYFQKNYNIDVDPGTISNKGGALFRTGSTSTFWYLTLPFPTRMRADPTITFYNGTTGATGTWRGSSSTDHTMLVSRNAQTSLSCTTSGNTSLNFLRDGFYTADAEL